MATVVSELVYYEHPLNERIRVFLRLECFFSQAGYFVQSGRYWESQLSINVLIEIFNILERTDIRSEALKELDRQIVALSRLMKVSGIDTERLEKTLDELNTQVKKLQAVSGKLSQEIRESELLTSIRHRSAISGGTCGFDIPSYHYWLHLPDDIKAKQLNAWVNEFAPIQESIQLVLRITRESGGLETKLAKAGLFYQVLDAHHPCSLVRLALPTHTAVYPEMSGNRHRINIRLMAYTERGRPKQITHDLEFSLCCCVI